MSNQEKPVKVLNSKCEQYVNLFVSVIKDHFGFQEDKQGLLNRDKECDKEFVTVLQEINRLSLKVNCEPFRLKFSGYREEYTEQPSWVNSWRDDVPLGRKNKPYAVEITNGYSCREAYSLAGFKTPTEAESEATKQLVKYRKTLFPAQAGKGGKIASTFKKVWKLVATGIALTILILRELHFFEWLWEKMHWMWD